MRFAGWFLNALSERCLKECGRALTAIQFPVFKRFLSYRVKRELQFYRLCLDLAAVLAEAGCDIRDMDIDEAIEGSIDIDNRLRRDIKLLPIRIDYDYKKIMPIRKERIEKQTSLFIRFLSTGDVIDYNEMVRKAFDRHEFLERNNDILEHYVDEAFIINSSIKSMVDVDSEAIANRMYCSMLDIGISLNKQIADSIYRDDPIS